MMACPSAYQAAACVPGFNIRDSRITYYEIVGSSCDSTKARIKIMAGDACRSLCTL